MKNHGSSKPTNPTHSQSKSSLLKSEPQTTARPVRSVARRACLNCRERKIKCDGVQVCRNCKQLGLECIFVKSHRGGRRNRTKSKEVVDPSEFTLTTTQPAPNSSYRSFQHPPPSLPSLPQQNVAQSPLATFPNQSAMTSSNPPSLHNNQNYPVDYSPNEYPPYAFVPYLSQSQSQSQSPLQLHPQPQSHSQSQSQSPLELHPQPQSQSQSPPQEKPVLPLHKYSSLTSLPYARPPESTPKLDLPNISDEDSRRAVIAQLQLSIDDLQRQINNLKPSPEAALHQSTPPLHRWWEVDLHDLKALGLPSLDIIWYFIDLYYEYYHPNHLFLLPKNDTLQLFSFKSDVGLLHAMFSISCRFADSDPKRCEELGIYPYHKDPMYWISLFEKHRSTLYTSLLVKCLLMVGLAYASNGSQMSLQIMEEARQLCRWHNLDKRFCSSAEINNTAGETVLRSFSVQQLMHRESHIRTVWEIWKFQVQNALLNDDPDLIPPFNGDLCLPVSDTLYENKFKDWDFKCNFWCDLDADLLNRCNEAESSLSLHQSATSLAEIESSMYCSSCMYIVCLNLLALVFKHHKTESPGPVLRSFEVRLQVLFSKLPSTEIWSMTGGSFLMAYGSLFSATILLYHSRALPFLVYVPKKNATPESPVDCKEPATLAMFLQSPKSIEACRSYMMCQWAAQGVHQFVLGAPLLPGKTSKLDYWRGLPPLTGFVLLQVISVLASELVLQNMASSLGISLATTSRPPLALDFPTFAVDPALHPSSVPSSSSSTSSTTAVSTSSSMSTATHALPPSSPFAQPIGWHGDSKNVSSMILHLVELEEYHAQMWPKTMNYFKVSQYIVAHAMGFKSNFIY